MKCGTSSLHRYLDLHPEIAMSVLKEPNFFLDRSSWGKWEEGVDWYRSLFDGSARVRGEASVNYTNLPASAPVAERIVRTLGFQDPKLIYMVRDPIDRAVSHYLHAKAAGRERLEIEPALGDLNSRYVVRGLYATQLEPFVRRLGSEAIHVDTQEALLADRVGTMSRIFGFVGVDSGFHSPEFERMWEVSAGKSRRFEIAYRASRKIGGDVWGRLPTRLRWMGERLAYSRGKPSERPQISPELRGLLTERFAPELARLREMCGRELPELGPAA
jgi:hypothetical protein